jgi:3-deoxy-D-manno-octulosonic-acid transferase
LGVFIYNIFLLVYRLGISIAAIFNTKAKKWVQGRKNIFKNLEAAISKNEKVVWMHCASLGEFEQGRPVLEKIRSAYPHYKILLTFFSPSGYEIRKDYDGADWVFYLPMDGPANAKRFLEIVKPSLVIFVKYEFWYYYLKKIHYRKIPLLLISALFRKDMSFFKWYATLQRKMLTRFDHLFVQNTESQKLLGNISLAGNCTVAGDTRFDRVYNVAKEFKPIPAIEQFVGNSKVIIAGSTWPEDEEVLQKAFNNIRHPSLKLILAPHEINEKHIADLLKLFPNAIRFSQLATIIASDEANSLPLKTVLIIDNIGMLSRMYKYAWITYVGGAMNNRGIHNVLEAAVYNKIVLFGPVYEKYAEVIGLVKAGGGVPFNDIKNDGSLLCQLIEAMLENKDEYNLRSKAAGDYVRENLGATDKIIQFIQEKRLLTN